MLSRSFTVGGEGAIRIHLAHGAERRRRVLGRRSHFSRGEAVSQAASEQAVTISGKATPSTGQKLLLLVFAVFLCIAAFIGLDAAYSFLFRKSAVPTPSEIFGCLGRDRLRALALEPYCSCTRAWGHERYALNVNSLGNAR